MEYIYGNPNAHPWKNVASIFAAHDSLNSAQTSSLPLVQFWRASGKKYEGKQLNKDAQELLEKSLGGTVTDEDTQLCFEYAVPIHSNSGSGKASMTDLMILTKTHTIAVEAKWTECAKHYAPTINDWLNEKEEKKDNRKSVLTGWIKYINKYVGPSMGELDPDKIAETTIPYQLLHRIASACAVANERKTDAIVIYQLFYNDQPQDGMEIITEETVKNLAKELDSGYKALFKNDEPVLFYIIKTKVKPCKNIEALEQLCPVDTSKIGGGKCDWNALFLEMQKRPIYTFSDIELFPFDKK